MRILVTGSSGFLGRHILASPAAAGIRFFCATRAHEGHGELVTLMGREGWDGDSGDGAGAARGTIE